MRAVTGHNDEQEEGEAQNAEERVHAMAPHTTHARAIRIRGRVQTKQDKTQNAAQHSTAHNAALYLAKM
jgi:hypothetical protein